jgi:phospholipid/cholesterol/gamma-HCH transport system substrate-binding protein
MITRFVRFQLIAFVVVSVLAVIYLGGSYIRVDRMLGKGIHTVKLQLADSGGIFTNAEVTYRGITVGRVGELRLIPDGVEVDLVLDNKGPDIPADLHAVVANRSAVGEQYVDLQPKTDKAPYLKDGSVITKDRTATPLPVDRVMLNLDRLVSSVPTDDLRTVIDELSLAFTGTGPDLQRLLDATTQFTDTASEHLPQTLALLTDGRTVLNTFNEESGNFASFSRDLRLLAEQLNASDPDIRNLLAAGPVAAGELQAFIRDVGPGLGDLLADLIVVNTDVLLPRQDNIRVPLIAYPIIAGGGYGVLAWDGKQGDGTAHMSLGLNTFDPPPCVDGYQATPKREGPDVTPIPLNINVNCAAPLFSPVDVRGVKLGYPFVDGQPNPTVPEWVCVKYGDTLPGFTNACKGSTPAQPPGSTDRPGDGGADLPGGQDPAQQAGLPGLPGMPDGGGAIELLQSLLGTSR